VEKALPRGSLDFWKTLSREWEGTCLGEAHQFLLNNLSSGFSDFSGMVWRDYYREDKDFEADFEKSWVPRGWRKK
jgi:hypothetical protein